MPNSRREFLTQSALTLLASTAVLAQNPATPTTPGAPPAFGTSPAVGPEVSTNTFAEAEKLIQFPLTEKDRAQAAGNWRSAMAGLYERRTGPRKVAIPDTIAPYSRRRLPHPRYQPRSPRKINSSAQNQTPEKLPTSDEAIAFAPVHHLSRWIETRQLTSTRLTQHLPRPHRSPQLQRSTASSPSPATMPSRKPKQPTPKSPPDTIAAHSTASHGVQKTSSTPPTSPLPGEPNPSSTAFPRPTPPSQRASTKQAQSSSLN